ncbi:MAG: SPOR domain-containing protein [Nitrosomonadaceae bacterium]|jgi:DedD protein
MARVVSEQDLLLRKRARRRLVGAIALVIMAIVILPMVLDRVPKPESEEIEITIPSENLEAEFSPIVVPETGVSTIAGPDSKESALAAQQVEKTETNLLIRQAKEKQASKLVGSENDSEYNPDVKKPTTTTKIFVVQLGAFSDSAKAKHQQRSLTSNGIKRSYTETLMTNDKEVTRVRIGPFSSRKAAEEERKKLKKLGLDGVVMSK